MRNKYLITALMILWFPLAEAGKDEAAKYYEKAIIDFNKKEHKSAVIYLKNAIQQDPSYLAAYVLLGKAYLEVGNGPGAEKEIRRASVLGADQQLTLGPFAQALLIQNKYQKVLDEIPESGNPPAIQSELLIHRGEAFLELRETEKAFLSYSKAIRLNPKSAKAHLGLASVLIKQNLFDKAEIQITRALDFDAESTSAWQLKATIQYSQNNTEKALEYYSRALRSKPDDLTSLLGRAGVYYDIKQYQNSLTDLKILVEKYPVDPRVNYLHYLTLKATGNTKDAQDSLTKSSAYLQKIPENQLNKHATMLLLAGIVNFELQQTEKAYGYLTTYVKRYPNELYAELTLGRVLLAKDQSKDALIVLESAYKKRPDDYQTLTLLGTAYMNTHLYTKANDMFEKAISLQGDKKSARFQKTFNELRSGKEENASIELEKLFNKLGDSRAGIMLITLNFKQQNMKQAEIIAKKIVKNEPNHLLARNLLGVAQLELGKLKEAGENFNAILKNDPDYFPAHMNIVKLDFMQGKLDSAETKLNTLIEKKENLSTVMVAYSNLAKRKKQADESIRWAEKAYDADNKNVSAILHLAETLLENGKNQKALRVSETSSMQLPDNMRIKSLLGRSYLAINKPDLAKSTFREMAKLASYDSEQLYEIARLQYSAGDYDAGLWSLRKSIEGDNTNAAAREALIETLISQQKLAEANEQIALIKPFTAEASYARLRGDWYQASNKPKSAIRWYDKSFEADANTDIVIRLYQAYLSNKQISKGINHLKYYLKKNQKNYEILNLLAEAYIFKNEINKAAEILEKVIAAQPNRASALNNLAYIYQNIGNKTAINLAKKAQSLEPNNPDYNDTLGWILVETGNPAEGLLYLRNAHTRSSENREIRYHIAVALNQLGRNEEALSELKAIINNKSKFPSDKQARALYNQLN